jgi:serine/threonine protein kinase|eukprot:COSAG01_NODE_1726_length_9377_cov_2.401272_4_plen_358_part_00
MKDVCVSRSPLHIACRNVDISTTTANKILVRPFEDQTQQRLDDHMEQHLRTSCPVSVFERKSTNFHGSIKCGNAIIIGGHVFRIVEKLGEGGYSTVYHARRSDVPAIEFALKVQSSCVRDLFVSRVLQERVGPQHVHMFCFCEYGVQFADRGFTLMPHGGRPLHHLLNAYIQRGEHVHELTAMHFTVELLRIIECLHESDILHLDIKPDNLLLRITKDSQSLQLIDFGRSLDLVQFPTNVSFQGDSRVPGYRCVEMQLGQPWRYQPDRHGICSTVHMLLLRTPLKERAASMLSRGTPCIRLKRYWECQVWQHLFEQLQACCGPVTSSLRHPLEAHLGSRACAESLRSQLAQHEWMLR